MVVCLSMNVDSPDERLLPSLSLTDPSLVNIGVPIGTTVTFASPPNQTCDGIGLALERQRAYGRPPALCACVRIESRAGYDAPLFLNHNQTIHRPTSCSLVLAVPLPPFCFLSASGCACMTHVASGGRPGQWPWPGLCFRRRRLLASDCASLS